MKYSLLGACAVAVCCTAPAFAQGLTRVETIALQQQLRDDGCGVTHVTGRMDATTRAAVHKCASKYSGATDAKSMLAAMDIGFGNGIPVPTLSMARSGAGGGSMSAGGISASSTTTDRTAGKAHMKKARPMMPSHGVTNPMAVPKHDTTTTPVDTSSGVMPTKPPLDTSAKRDTISTMPMMPMTPRRDTMPKKDTMPKRDTMPNSNSPRI